MKKTLIYLIALSFSFSVFGETQKQVSCESLLATKHEKRQRVRVNLKKRDPLIEEIEQFLKSTVIGQDEVIDAVLELLDQGLVQGTIKKGVLGALLVAGPTGVGKNYIFEQLAKIIGASLIELEGGNFTLKHQVTALIGAAPTFVGHGTTKPSLTQEKLDAAQGERLPITIIMLNELDKAHQTFIDWWLKTLDAGKNTVWTVAEEGSDSKEGIEVIVDFRRVMVIGTTNAGAMEILAQAAKIQEEVRAKDPDLVSEAFGVGVLTKHAQEEKGFREGLNRVVMATFGRPEFIGRFDAVKIAWPLLDKGYEMILGLELKKARAFLESIPEIAALPLKITKRGKKFLLSHVDPFYGARNLTKIVKKYVTAPLARAIGAKEVQSGDYLIGDVDVELNYNDEGHIIDEEGNTLDPASVSKLFKGITGLDFFKSGLLSRMYGPAKESIVKTDKATAVTDQEIERAEDENTTRPKKDNPAKKDPATNRQEIEDLLQELITPLEDTDMQKTLIEFVKKIINTPSFDFTFAHTVLNELSKIHSGAKYQHAQIKGELNYYELMEKHGINNTEKVDFPFQFLVMFHILNKIDTLTKDESEKILFAALEAKQSNGIFVNDYAEKLMLQVNLSQLINKLIDIKVRAPQESAE